MDLDPDRWNDFADSKREGMYLPCYADGHEFKRSRPQPSGAGQPGLGGAGPAGRNPVVGDRVKVGDGIGTVVEEPKDQRSPRWRVDFGAGSRPQWFARNVMTILPS